MKKILFILLTLVLLSAQAHDTHENDVPKGVITVVSDFNVSETASRLENAIEASPLTLLFTIDHQANAVKVEKELRPTIIFIFGNPNVGTPLMQDFQSIAMDLPQKMLVWEAEDGQVYLGYNDPYYIAERHGISGHDERLEKISNALAGLAKAAGKNQ